MNDTARATKIVGDVVDSLKDVIRRHQVTIGEFGEAIGYVRSVVADGELDLLSAVLFEAVIDDAVDAAAAGGTASNVEGPFYAPGAPMLDADGVLPMRAGEPGEQLMFSGSVRSTDGRPLASAMVDIWQADAAGCYSQFAPDVPRWNLRGRIRTDADGRFAFRTVVPAAYDIPGLPHTARLLAILGLDPHRPAHVHLKVAADGHRDLTTQVYFAGDPWLERDV
ncbi:MAG: catechol 1,2-dioxygenase, partial [Pseudonocardia sp.]|nr:catechol 1,2-dioxygenase [Pseudonocardia sp.]